MTLTKTLFAVGEVVPESGWYLCVPCGFADEFMAGDAFPVCKACLAGTSDGPDGYTEPHVEYWERLT
ncbi:MAG TPA: hypothetical protein VMU11_00410 [Verrucomicrobiae bacterium]|nr:hypothetical protein [Verrucomicrobiae bacterium]